MANYKKLSEYIVDESPSDGDLIPSIVDNGNGTYTNVLIPYSTLKGLPGTDGVGVPVGGTAGQVLTKSGSSDYATQWTSMTLDKTAVGLPNVDNTSDINKPVSTATQNAINTAVALAVAQAKQEAYPVGSLYFNADNPANPATLLGFGTWVAHAEGRVPVGKAASGTFGTAGATGGSETHRHKGYGDGDGLGNGDLRATVGSGAADAASINFQALDAINPNTGAGMGNGTYKVVGSNQGSVGFSHFTKVVGYTSTNSHLQPYVVVYIWKRTA